MEGVENNVLESRFLYQNFNILQPAVFPAGCFSFSARHPVSAANRKVQQYESDALSMNFSVPDTTRSFDPPDKNQKPAL